MLAENVEAYVSFLGPELYGRQSPASPVGQDVRQCFMGYKTVTKPDPAQACVRKVSFTENGLHILKELFFFFFFKKNLIAT